MRHGGHGEIDVFRRNPGHTGKSTAQPDWAGTIGPARNLGTYPVADFLVEKTRDKRFHRIALGTTTKILVKTPIRLISRDPHLLLRLDVILLDFFVADRPVLADVMSFLHLEIAGNHSDVDPLPMPRRAAHHSLVIAYELIAFVYIGGGIDVVDSAIRQDRTDSIRRASRIWLWRKNIVAAIRGVC